MYIVQRNTLTETLTLTGKIEAEEKATLQFQSAGRLSWVGVKEGDSVKKYQGIASLDQRELQKKIERYLNTYSKARWTYDQTKDENEELTSSGLTEELRSKASRLIDQAQFDLNNAVLDVEMQTLAKEYAYLYTPINGIVIRADVTQAGVNIIPTQAQFEIVNPETMYFSVNADQTEVVKLWESQQGEIILDAYPDKTLFGDIYDISFTPKQGESGTVYEVKIHLDDSVAQYRLGMSGDITFTLREAPNVIAIPSAYIVSENDKNYVEKKIGDKKKRVEITLGSEVDGEVEIVQGLDEGDVIYEIKK